uniref:Uncharacterized protein n=1 Tax=Meloidogyne floridensis TaxID=298350 RepID=A0A915NKW8_9BILA
MSFSTILTTQCQNNLNYATAQIKNEAEDFFLRFEDQMEDYYCCDDLSSIQSTIESSIFSSSTENCLILNDYWLFNEDENINNKEDSSQNEDGQYFSSSSFSSSMSSPSSSSNQLNFEDNFSFDYSNL